MIDELLLKFWKPILALLVVALVAVGWKIEESRIDRLQGAVTTAKAENATLQGELAAMVAEGKKQQATIDSMASDAATQAEKVVVKWKTKYVPQPIPEDCTSAIAVAAENASAVARTYLDPN
jgi:hypothetical protein